MTLIRLVDTDINSRAPDADNRLEQATAVWLNTERYLKVVWVPNEFGPMNTEKAMKKPNFNLQNVSLSSRWIMPLTTRMYLELQLQVASRGHMHLLSNSSRRFQHETKEKRTKNHTLMSKPRTTDLRHFRSGHHRVLCHRLEGIACGCAATRKNHKPTCGFSVLPLAPSARDWTSNDP